MGVGLVGSPESAGSSAQVNVVVAMRGAATVVVSGSQSAKRSESDIEIWSVYLPSGEEKGDEAESLHVGW